MQKTITTKTILILATLALTLGGCADNYNQKPDNQLKPSPCACNEPVFNATELGLFNRTELVVLDSAELGFSTTELEFFNKTQLS